MYRMEPAYLNYLFQAYPKYEVNEFLESLLSGNALVHLVGIWILVRNYYIIIMQVKRHQVIFINKGMRNKKTILPSYGRIKHSNCAGYLLIICWF